MVTVLHVIDTLGLGGAERFLVNLVRYLDREHYHPIVAWLSAEGPFARDLRAAGVEVVGIRARGHRDPRAIRRLYSLMRERRVDILHTHLFVDGFYGRLAALWARVPVRVVTQQNAYDDPQLRLPAWQIWANRALVPFTQRFVAVSQAAKQYLIEVEWVPEDKIRVLPNAIEPPPPVAEEVVRRLRQQWGNGPLLGTVARLEPQKGLDTLLKAVALLKQRNAEVRCIIVGEGKARTELEAQARTLGIADAVLFVGTRRDIPAVLAALDVFVLPSRFEGLSLALLEAMAAGCPVVATAVSGSVEVVHDGETGLLVPPGDAKALAEAVYRLLTNSELARRVALAGKELVLKHYTIEPIAGRYEEIYAAEMEKAQR